MFTSAPSFKTFSHHLQGVVDTGCSGFIKLNNCLLLSLGDLAVSVYCFKCVATINSLSLYTLKSTGGG